MLIIICSKESKDPLYTNLNQQRQQDFEWFIFLKRKYKIHKNAEKCKKENEIKFDKKTSQD